MFLSTIGLTTDKAIGTVLSKSGGSRTNDVSDKRGKAEPENKKNGETSGLVNHHYRWSHAPNRLCISPEYNISAMFKDFCSRYEDVKISYVYFNKKVKKKMNISFVKLGKEECERCDIHKSNQIKQFILLHDFYKFWYTLTKIKWLNFTVENHMCGDEL